MAKVSQFVGSSWIAGATLPAHWQLTAGGTMDECGSVTVNSVSDYETNITVNVKVSIGTFNETVDIKLTDQNAGATSGPYSITIGGDAQNHTYSEGNAHAPHDYPSGNAIFLKGASYKSHGFSAQIWPVKNEQTLLYIDPSSAFIPGFWLLIG